MSGQALQCESKYHLKALFWCKIKPIGQLIENWCVLIRNKEQWSVRVVHGSVKMGHSLNCNLSLYLLQIYFTNDNGYVFPTVSQKRFKPKWTLIYTNHVVMSADNADRNVSHTVAIARELPQHALPNHRFWAKNCLSLLAHYLATQVHKKCESSLLGVVVQVPTFQKAVAIKKSNKIFFVANILPRRKFAFKEGNTW